MIQQWRKMTPVYVSALSSVDVLAAGELFHIGDGELHLNNPLAPHWHDYYEMGFFHSGTGIEVVGDHEYPYEPGQVYIINGMEPHMGYSHDPRTSLFVVHFHPALVNDNWITRMRTEAHVPFLPDFSRYGPIIPLNDSVTVPVRNLLERVRIEAIQREDAWEVVVGGLILQAIGLLARRLLAVASPSLEDQKRREALKRIHPVIRLIEDRYAAPLTLDEMAAAACVSRSHCCALFQLALDTTPIAYRNSRRLTEAQRLLQGTDQTICEIAYQIGFSSVQEFNRLFLRKIGMTPTRFRQHFYKSVQNISS